MISDDPCPFLTVSILLPFIAYLFSLDLVTDRLSSWWAYRPHLVLTTMCTYILLIPACHHQPLLLFDTSCRLRLQELQRINHRAAWDGSSLSEIPFNVPESCHPGTGNIRPIYTSDSCRWDCRYIQCIASSDMR
ncbi:hypothetical protein CGRA01v4_06399 [Colletotrichum graminicola]|nr:hypothetical protein CGRA01v4_06399 [Colletotrichum graminicola]